MDWSDVEQTVRLQSSPFSVHNEIVMQYPPWLYIICIYRFNNNFPFFVCLVSLPSVCMLQPLQQNVWQLRVFIAAKNLLVNRCVLTKSGTALIFVIRPSTKVNAMEKFEWQLIRCVLHFKRSNYVYFLSQKLSGLCGDIIHLYGEWYFSAQYKTHITLDVTFSSISTRGRIQFHSTTLFNESWSFTWHGLWF